MLDPNDITNLEVRNWYKQQHKIQSNGEMQFDILVTMCNNEEWLTPFLTSLANTLFDKTIRIYIVDGSNDYVHSETIAIRDNFLNVFPNIFLFRSTAPGHSSSILEALESLDLHEYVCACDVDVCMFRKSWDVFIKRNINEGFTMISSSPRFTCAEIHFVVARQSVMLESKFANGPDADFEWDSDVLPHSESEHLMLTYFELKRGGKLLLFDKVGDPCPYWGSVVFDSEGKEFLYHNFWSSRTKDKCQHPVDDECFMAHYRHILSGISNASKITKYLQKVYPSSFTQFISNERKQENIVLVGDGNLCEILREFMDGAPAVPDEIVKINPDKSEYRDADCLYLMGSQLVDQVIESISDKTRLIFVSSCTRRDEDILRIGGSVINYDGDMDFNLCRGIIMVRYCGQKGKIYSLSEDSNVLGWVRHDSAENADQKS